MKSDPSLEIKCNKKGKKKDKLDKSWKKNDQDGLAKPAQTSFTIHGLKADQIGSGQFSQPGRKALRKVTQVGFGNRLSLFFLSIQV